MIEGLVILFLPFALVVGASYIYEVVLDTLTRFVDWVRGD